MTEVLSPDKLNLSRWSVPQFRAGLLDLDLQCSAFEATISEFSNQIPYVDPQSGKLGTDPRLRGIVETCRRITSDVQRARNSLAEAEKKNLLSTENSQHLDSFLLQKTGLNLDGWRSSLQKGSAELRERTVGLDEYLKSQSGDESSALGELAEFLVGLPGIIGGAVGATIRTTWELSKNNSIPLFGTENRKTLLRAAITGGEEGGRIGTNLLLLGLSLRGGKFPKFPDVFRPGPQFSFAMSSASMPSVKQLSTGSAGAFVQPKFPAAFMIGRGNEDPPPASRPFSEQDFENEATEIASNHFGFKVSPQKSVIHGHGFGNVVVKVEGSKSGQVAVVIARAPAAVTNEDLQSERMFLEWGAKRDFTPKVYQVGLTPSGRGFLVEEFIDGRALANDSISYTMHRDPYGWAREIVRIAKKIHTSDLRLPRTQNMAQRLDIMLQKLGSHSAVTSPSELIIRREELINLVNSGRGLAEPLTRDIPLVPVHNDLKPGNFIKAPRRLVLVDVEGVSMGWAAGEVGGLGPYFAMEGKGKVGIETVARMYGVSTKDPKFWAPTFFKLARSAAANLEWLFVNRSIDAHGLRRVDLMLENARIPISELEALR